METETLAQKAFRLLSEVPQNDFIIGEFGDGIGKCCAIGHFQRLTSSNPTDYSNNNCCDNDRLKNDDLRTASNNFLRQKYGLKYSCIANVNNANKTNGYTEEIIKDRVIHLLKDMVAEGL